MYAIRSYYAPNHPINFTIPGANTRIFKANSTHRGARNSSFLVLLDVTPVALGAAVHHGLEENHLSLVLPVGSYGDAGVVLRRREDSETTFRARVTSRLRLDVPAAQNLPLLEVQRLDVAGHFDTVAQVKQRRVQVFYRLDVDDPGHLLVRPGGREIRGGHAEHRRGVVLGRAAENTIVVKCP